MAKKVVKGHVAPVGAYGADARASEEAAAPPAGLKMSEDQLALVQQMQAKMAEQHRTVRILLKEWDTSGNQQVSEKEFVSAVQSMKLTVDVSVIQGLFRTIDKDGSGSVDFDEMELLFKAGRPVRTAKDFLKESSMKNKALKEQKAQKVVKHKEVQKPDAMKEEMEDTSLALLQRLQDVLAANRSTVSAMLKAWDTNGDGQVSEQEFIVAILKLGSRLGYDKMSDEDSETFLQRVTGEIQPAAEALFRSVDTDGSGQCDFGELSQLFKFKKPVRTAEDFLRESQKRDGAVKAVPKSGEWDNYFINHNKGQDKAKDAGKTELEVGEQEYDLVRYLQEKIKVTRMTSVSFLRRWDKNKGGQVSEREFVDGVKDLTMDKDEDGHPIGDFDPTVAKSLFAIVFADSGNAKTVGFQQLHEFVESTPEANPLELSEEPLELAKQMKAKLKSAQMSLSAFVGWHDKNRDGHVSQHEFLVGLMELIEPPPRDASEPDKAAHLKDWLASDKAQTAKAAWEVMKETSARVGLLSMTKIFEHGRQPRTIAEHLKVSTKKHADRVAHEKQIPLRVGWESSMQKRSYNKAIKDYSRLVPFGKKTARENYAGWLEQFAQTNTSYHLGPGSYPNLDSHGGVSFEQGSGELVLAQKMQEKLVASRASVRAFWKRPWDVHGARVIRIEVWEDKASKAAKGVAFHISDGSERHFGMLGTQCRRQEFVFNENEYLVEVTQQPGEEVGFGSIGFTTSIGRTRIYGATTAEERSSFPVTESGYHIMGLTFPEHHHKGSGPDIIEGIVQMQMEVKVVWKSWGVDREGFVPFTEFARSVAHLTIPRNAAGEPLEEFDTDACQALFKKMDENNKGTVDFRAIHAMFREGKPQARTAKELLKQSSMKFKRARSSFV